MTTSSYVYFGIRVTTLTWLVCNPGATVSAEVFSWECNSVPTKAGWDALPPFCEPETWVDDGWYVQQLDMDACPNDSAGAMDPYRREMLEYVGEPMFFVEWRVEGDGPRSEIVGGAPATMAVGNSFGIRYTFFVARDQAKLNRDNLLPIVFVDFAPDVPHTHRLELYGEELYNWFIDGQVVDSGKPEGEFPSFNAFIVWTGRSWHAPAYNRWDFIRYGTIPIDASGDLDSDGDHDVRDFYFLHECILGVDRPVMPDGRVDPGCLWADINGDGTVNLLDFADFQVLASDRP